MLVCQISHPQPARKGNQHEKDSFSCWQIPFRVGLAKFSPTSSTKRMHEQHEKYAQAARKGFMSSSQRRQTQHNSVRNRRQCLLRAARKECMSGTKRIHDQHEIKCTEAILSLKAEVRAYLSAYHEDGNSQPKCNRLGVTSSGTSPTRSRLQRSKWIIFLKKVVY